VKTVSKQTPLDGDADLTALLLAWRAGDAGAFDHVMTAVYTDLRRMAHRHLRNERPDHTLGTTGLVHEAYFRLVDQNRIQWADRSHFFTVAAHAMRRILVDYARRLRTEKRGGAAGRVSLTDAMVAAEERADTLCALDEALNELGEIGERLKQVVECRFFAGLTEQETADVLGVTERTVRRDWIKAKGWLHRALSKP